MSKPDRLETKEVKLAGGVEERLIDMVCFSHLPWNFVYQRPQHLLTRFAQNRRVFYVEEPEIDESSSRLKISHDKSGVVIVVPVINKALDKFEGRAVHRALINQLLEQFNIHQYFFWYYTPMAIGYTDHLNPIAVVYDCMDELSAFNGAPAKMRDYEKQLLQRSDLVFTGGHSLYESKRDTHPSVYAFPSSIDVEHFSKARNVLTEPADQASIPHPRLGYFGVIDERMDLNLVAGIADSHPGWHIVMIGPIAKVAPENLPRRQNIHYLGMKDYQQLPSYLSGWDVALLPFALNKATKYISPTKIPEYLSGGKQVVSTPIKDVVNSYGEMELVRIAKGVEEFVNAIERSLESGNHDTSWLTKVDNFLSQSSWDLTWMSMQQLVGDVIAKRLNPYRVNHTGPLSTMPGTGIDMPLQANPIQHFYTKGRSREFDYLVVGAGFSGSILAERLACGSGKKVLLVDCRPHIAGNAYDYYDKAGILIHKYGPHIFHTNSKEVFTYLSRFTGWRPYEHRVRASVDGQLLPIPINLDTINQLYGLQLSSFELEKFFDSIAETRDQVRTSEDVVVSKVGRELYEKFFRNYTRKQWDLDPSELDASVTSRVPIRLNRDDRYFTDTYQSMPLYGYTQLFENMLDHPNIKIMLNTDFRDIAGYIDYGELIYTGPVDEFFNFRYGKLPYRSLKFKFETLEEQVHQPVAVINYPNEHAYTRVTEFKYLTGQEHNKTTLVYEYPCAEGDPYYPIPRTENAVLYKKYKELADSTPGVYFAGRLATYKYYNMDQVAAQALTLYARITGLNRSESISTYKTNGYTVDMPCTLLIEESDP
ncbi:MAG: UDP-galactopyranose mutase [Omnitrophica WOR_2 bacterium]